MSDEVSEFFLTQVPVLIENEKTELAPENTYFPDKWIAASCLQKAIRRGHTNMAVTAFNALAAFDLRMCKRRIAIIALEDIGVSDIELVGLTLFICLKNGALPFTSRFPALRYCVAAMSKSAKERSGDYLQTMLELHPHAIPIQQSYLEKGINELVEDVQETSLDWRKRSLAATLLAGTNRLRGTQLPRSIGDPEAFTWSVQQLNVPFWVPQIADLSYRLLGEAMAAQFPIKVSLALEPETQHQDDMKWEHTAGIPHYALDKHTRLGKQAFRLLPERNIELSNCLKSLVPAHARQPAIEWLMFYIEASQLDLELQFQGYEEIKQEGIEADLARSGLQSIANKALYQCLLEAGEDLAQIRAELLTNAVKMQETAHA